MLTEAEIRRIVREEIEALVFSRFPQPHWHTHLPQGQDPFPWGSGGGLDVDMVDGLHASEIGGGDWQVLSEVEVTLDCDYVDFTGLDINSDWFYILFACIKNPTASDSHYYLFTEGDYTATNYYNQYIYGHSTSLTTNRVNHPSLGDTTSGERIFITARITRDSDGYFRYFSSVNFKTGSNQELILRAGSKTTTVTNITQLRISAQVSGAIGAGSKFILARPRS